MWWCIPFIPSSGRQRHMRHIDLRDFVSSPLSALLLQGRLSSQNCLISFPVLGLQACMAVPGFLSGCLGFDLRSSCLQSKPSYGWTFPSPCVHVLPLQHTLWSVDLTLKNNMIVFKNGQIISLFEVYNEGGTFIAVSGHMSGEHSLVTKRKA